MKKFILLSLLGLLIMGLSVPVYAQIDFKAYGGLFAGGLLSKNVLGGAAGQNITSTLPAPDVSALDRTQSFYSSYANIFFEWNVGKEVKGVFNVETCNYHSGTNTINRTTILPGGNPLGNLAQGAEFDTGLWNTRVGQTRLRTAYVQFALPYFGIPFPMSITTGVIPMAVRPTFVFANTNGGGLQFDLKADPAAFTFTWGKMAEGKTAISDDSDFYSLEGRTKMGPATVGGYLIFNNMKTYPISYNELAYGTSNNQEAIFWWLGFYADGKTGPFNFNFDFAYDTGKVEARESALGPGIKDVKYRGWATQLKLTYPWEKWTFGVLGMYASGADQKKTSRNGLPNTDVAYPGTGAKSTKVNSFLIPAGSASWVVWGESMFLGGHFSTIICIPQGMAAGDWLVSANRGSIGGTWVGKLFASYPVTDKYKVTMWGLYIGDTTKNGNTLGNAVKSDGRLRDDKGIGWELALVQDINIYKNLILTFGSGILFAGDALDQKKAGVNDNNSIDSPWIVDAKVSFMF